MYARGQREDELTFDFAEGLIKNNLLMVDRETRSVWSQLHGRAVSGPREGQLLQTLPAIQSTWGFWRERHPDTRVMVDRKRPGHPYFYRTWIPGQPRPQERSVEHDTANLGLGLTVGSEAVFFPFSELDRTRLYKTVVGGQPVRIHFHPEGLTAWADDGQSRLLPGILLTRQAGWIFTRTRESSRPLNSVASPRLPGSEVGGPSVVDPA